MNDDVYRNLWFESAHKRACKLGYTLYRCITFNDDEGGYILEDCETNDFNGICTAVGVEAVLDQIECDRNNDDYNEPF